MKVDHTTARKLTRDEWIAFNMRWEQAGIPLRPRERTFSGYRITTGLAEQKKIAHTCKRYADEFAAAMQTGASLVMAGTTGTGKTHLIVAILRTVIYHGYTARYITANDLLRRYKGTFSHDSTENEAQVIRDYTRPDLLAIDEIGAGYGTDTERLVLSEVISKRYDHNKPTIIAGNCTPDELADTLGDRIMSRLQEGDGPALVFDWKDFRTTA